MKAMVFAAGMGTRLKPLTDHIPKALVRIGEKTLLELVITKLIRLGVREMVVNVHHFPDQIRDFLEDKQNFGIRVEVSDESGELLDTGGGLLKAAPYLEGKESVIIHNVDIITDLDLADMIAYHQSKGALATLAVRKRETSRYLLFDREMRLTGWTNKDTGEIKEVSQGSSIESEPYAYSGIQVIDPVIFQLMTRTGKFSIIDFYLEIGGSHPVYGYVDHSPFWIDVGKPKQLEEVKEILRRQAKGESKK